ncbi:unnamed protein product [Prunus brigantina]
MRVGRHSQSLTLIPLDPEIERTLHKLNKRKRRKDAILEKPSLMAEEPKPEKAKSWLNSQPPNSITT